MNPHFPTLALFALALAGCTSPYLSGYLEAERIGRPFKPVTAFVPKLQEDEAYRIQRRLTAQRLARGDRIAGYKGGLMSSRSMADKGIDHPLVAPLFESGHCLSPEGILSLRRYRRAAIELKLAYLIDRDGRSSKVLPFIDMPDIAYADPNRYGAIDMIAAGISAACFISGNAVALEEVAAPDIIHASISRGGTELTRGTGAESMTGQAHSLSVMMDMLRLRGFQLRPGMVVVTGKMGAKIDGLPGRYTADFGPLGRIDFELAN